MFGSNPVHIGSKFGIFGEFGKVRSSILVEKPGFGRVQSSVFPGLAHFWRNRFEVQAFWRGLKGFEVQFWWTNLDSSEFEV